MKNGILVAKSGGDLEKALSHKFDHVTFYIHSVIPSKKSNCSEYPIFSSCLFFSLRKVETKSLELFWQDFTEVLQLLQFLQ